MPAAERVATEDRWGEAAPKASADLWPSPERAADPWSRPRTESPGLGGEPTGEGYAAWDAAPSSWIGWNTPSDDRVAETVALETPEPPISETEPEADQDETAPFAWPDEPAESIEPVAMDVASEPDTAESAMIDDAAAMLDARQAEPDAVRESEEPLDPIEGDPARDGWDAYIAARESARAKATEGDVIARSMSLVEQLRDLLPAIVLSDPATMRRVAGDLSAARVEASALPREDLDRLRGVLETSRDNPRDIEALMELGKHAEDLLGLMGSFQRYAGAVDRAVGELTQVPAAPTIEGVAKADELPAESAERPIDWG